MRPEEARAGLTITNGSSAVHLTTRVDHDPTWKVAGWRGPAVGLEEFGGNVGTTEFVPDYLLSDYRPLPEDWTPVVGGGLEERYVPRNGSGTRYRREVRRVG